MKLLVTSFLSLLIGRLCAQDSTLFKYERRSDTLVYKLKSRNITGDEKKELKQIAFIIQNHAQTLSDSHNDYLNSLNYTNKAIKLFVYLEDTLSQANNRKYKGYLLGMLKEYSNAKAETQAAIKLYTLKSSFTGIAVSQFDLSRVYDQEKKLDSAIYFCMLSLEFWKTKTNPWRVFNVQTMLIHLLTKSKRYQNAILIQRECEKLLANKEINSRDRSDFYFVLVQLYKSTGQNKLRQFYQLKLKEAKKNSPTFNSYYGAS